MSSDVADTTSFTECTKNTRKKTNYYDIYLKSLLTIVVVLRPSNSFNKFVLLSFFNILNIFCDRSHEFSILYKITCTSCIWELLPKDKFQVQAFKCKVMKALKRKLKTNNAPHSQSD